MSGAGLAASHALASIETATLLASGFQTLLLVPVVLLLLLAVSDVVDNLKPLPRSTRTITWAKHGWKAAINVVIAFMAFYVALVPSALVVAGLNAVSRSAEALFALTLLSSVAVPLGLARAVVGPAGEPPFAAPTHPREARAQETTSRADLVVAEGHPTDAGAPAGVPSILRGTIALVARVATAGLIGVGLLMFFCVATLALSTGERARHVASLELPAPSFAVLTVASIVIVLLFTLVLLAMAGAFLQRLTVRRAAGQVDEVHQRARTNLMLASCALISLFVMPQSWGLYFVVLLLAGMFADRMPFDLDESHADTGARPRAQPHGVPGSRPTAL